MCVRVCSAEIAQLGERQTEDLKVPCSIHGFGKRCGVCGTHIVRLDRHQWFSGKMNGSHSFAPGSIPGWCIAPGWSPWDSLIASWRRGSVLGP